MTASTRNIWIAEYAKGIEYTIFDPYKRLFPVRTTRSRVFLIDPRKKTTGKMTGEKGLLLIGAGFSKTGTKTMHKVYEILGYGVNDSQENVYA